MTESERYAQYLICKQRGEHGFGALSEGSWDICPDCGTRTRWISVFQEKNVPLPPEVQKRMECDLLHTKVPTYTSEGIKRVCKECSISEEK